MFSWSTLFQSVLISLISSDKQPCQHLKQPAKLWDCTRVYFLPSAGETLLLHLLHALPAVVPPDRGSADPKWVKTGDRAPVFCDSAKHTLLTRKHKMFKNNVEEPNPSCSAEAESEVGREQIPLGTTRWRSGTDTSAVTSTCWLNTTSCTVVQQIWLTVGGSDTNTRRLLSASCSTWRTSISGKWGGGTLTYVRRPVKTHGRVKCAHASRLPRSHVLPY